MASFYDTTDRQQLMNAYQAQQTQQPGSQFNWFGQNWDPSMQAGGYVNQDPNGQTTYDQSQPIPVNYPMINPATQGQAQTATIGQFGAGNNFNPGTAQQAQNSAALATGSNPNSQMANSMGMASGSTLPANTPAPGFSVNGGNASATAGRSSLTPVTNDSRASLSPYLSPQPGGAQPTVNNQSFGTPPQQQGPSSLPVTSGQPYDANSGTPNNPGSIVPGATSFDPNTITAAQAGNAPQIPGQYSQAFSSDYNNYMNNIASQMQQQYQYNTPLASAAANDMSQVQTPGAQQFGTSSQLAQLLSGQGYDPATLARMHSLATDQISQNNAAQMGQTRRQLGQAGLDQSPAGAAIAAQQVHQGALDQNNAYNQIEVGNAQVGNSNLLAGVGQQSTIGMSNMEQANSMALANANRLFSALSQNTANQQQTNLSNAGAQQQQMMNQANQVSGFVGNQGNMFGNASLNRSFNADSQNAANAQNNNQFNANMSQGANIYNNNLRENRLGQAQGILGGAGFPALG